ncbi:hypothetical protein F8M41_023092 [Gigaspora margarita]|uniref:Uncharacterized protein n=1 Tax=Gigaspora margarita TaxID=4874 RepID=A0A8H4AE11_GIGMA|nr:hypothetical protein F8M41_023092 [Gigaspora margarita]
MPRANFSQGRIETPDVSPIEVMYCEAAIEQHPIYLILDTGSSKSLASHEFLKKIGKEIDKPSIKKSDRCMWAKKISVRDSRKSTNCRK